MHIGRLLRTRLLYNHPNMHVHDATKGDPVTPEECGLANLVSSEAAADPSMHLPVLDLDFQCDLVPSSTPGRYHLYLGKALTWEQYLKLLEVLVEVGLYNKGYLVRAKERGCTLVRTPWTLKVPGRSLGDAESAEDNGEEEGAEEVAVA